MRLEHVGLAAHDAPATLATLERLLGVAAYKTETVEREGVRTFFLDMGAKLEVLEALGPDSPVARHLERRGEGVHHLAFGVDDVDAAFARLREAGFPLLADAPKPGADGKRIFFVHPKATHGILVEFCGDDARLPEPTFFEHDGARLAAYRFGNEANPPLLLLHGAAGSTLLETLPLARGLEPRFHVLAFDYASHGASEDGGPVTFDALAASARAALDAFGLDRAHVFGYSLGGAVALLLAARHPERVTRLAVHAANLLWDSVLVGKMTRRLNADVLAHRYPDAFARLDAAHGGRARSLFARVAAFSATIPGFADRVPGVLAAVRAPALVSAGDRDDLFPLARTLDLHGALADAALCILPGHRHGLTPDASRALAPHLLAHLGA